MRNILENFLKKDVNLKDMSPLTLAFIGDGVYELFVREYLVGKGNCPVKKLHTRSVEMVKCASQAKFLDEKLISEFSQEEKDVYMRGRNAHVKAPKNANIADYHKATGLEAVFGYLYLKGEIERLIHFFGLMVND